MTSPASAASAFATSAASSSASRSATSAASSFFAVAFAAFDIFDAASDIFDAASDTFDAALAAPAVTSVGAALKILSSVRPAFRPATVTVSSAFASSW